MRCLAVVDKKGTAIDNLTRDIAKYTPHIKWRILPVHPKRPDPDTLEIFKNEAEQADLILWQYWKSAEMLREKFPEAKKKPGILSHYNPYDLKQSNWGGYQAITVDNKAMKQELPQANLIELCVDTDLFPWNREYNLEDFMVGMVASRIEGKKGILPVAKACAELGVKFVLVGRISDQGYWEQINDVFRDNPSLFKFYCDVDHATLVRCYNQMSLLVVNSVDNFESGPLPALEAMSVGVPVLSRSVGHMKDLEPGAFKILDSDPDDCESIKKQISDAIVAKSELEQLREKGWSAIKYRDARYYAAKFEGLIYETFFGKPMVSVIIPTYNRSHLLPKLVKRLIDQTYQAIEIVICDDNSTDDTAEVVKEMQKVLLHPIKYINTANSGYGLAQARNMGALVASGDYFMFCDDRHLPDKDAVEKFLNSHTPKSWNYGLKDSYRKGQFVENFSFIERQDFFDPGMFCERITEYGGMSQETRVRYNRSGVTFKEIDTNAQPLEKTKSRNTKRDQIIHSKHLLWKIGK